MGAEATKQHNSILEQLQETAKLQALLEQGLDISQVQKLGIKRRVYWRWGDSMKEFRFGYTKVM